MKNSEKYLLSFTAAGVMLNESIKIAEEYLHLKDWEKVNSSYIETNLLQSRTSSRSQRVFQEIKKRLTLLTVDQIETLVDGSIQDQKLILWFVICKCYQFVREFALEVIHEKFLSMNYQISDLDYDGFFIKKTDWHPELDDLKPTTKLKLKTVLFRMLREVDILSKDHKIIPVNPSKRIVDLIDKDGSVSLDIFPIFIGKNGG